MHILMMNIEYILYISAWLTHGVRLECSTDDSNDNNDNDSNDDDIFQLG